MMWVRVRCAWVFLRLHTVPRTAANDMQRFCCPQIPGSHREPLHSQLQEQRIGEHTEDLLPSYVCALPPYRTVHAVRPSTTMHTRPLPCLS